MNENPMDSKVRGLSFSSGDRTKIKSAIKKIIEKLILPFIEKKIRSLEGGIANTRKGVKNQFKNFWKKSERTENEGLRDNFKVSILSSLVFIFTIDEQIRIRVSKFN